MRKSKNFRKRILANDKPNQSGSKDGFDQTNYLYGSGENQQRKEILNSDAGILFSQVDSITYIFYLN